MSIMLKLKMDSMKLFFKMLSKFNQQKLQSLIKFNLILASMQVATTSQSLEQISVLHPPKSISIRFNASYRPIAILKSFAKFRRELSPSKPSA